MNRPLLGIVLALGWGAVLANAVMAQGYRGPGPGYVMPPTNTPMLSPYLNLLRGGNPAANYYLGVVPEQQRRTQAAQFSGAINNQIFPQLNSIEDTLTGEVIPQLSPSRVPAGFGNGPPRQFGRGSPGTNGSLPLPPEPRVPPKPMEKL